MWQCYNQEEMEDMNMKKETISKIVKASGVAAGELILVQFWGEDSDKQIANDFIAAVAALGGSPVLLQQSRTINRDIFASANESSFGENYFDFFSSFDAVLDIFAYQPAILGYELEQEKFDLYRRYIGQLFSKLVQSKRFTQIRIPTTANAEESGLEPEDFKRRMNNAYDINYDELSLACKKEIERFAGVHKVSLRTGSNCVLNFELEDRNWHIDAGDGDLPCGEIYIAVIEDKTQGSVFFDTLYLENGMYHQVVLQVEEGKVCGSNLQEVAQFFKEMPEENRVVCELGFGMNPNVTELCGYTVLDEKMANTFHIAVGANHMFGGANKASDHIDFVGIGTCEFN